MRKNKMLQIIDELQQVNEIILDYSIVHSDMVDMLVQCQELAILLGTDIEKRYMLSCREKAEAIVIDLEDYCENIYQLTISLDDKKRLEKLKKVIQKQVIQLGNNINYELPDDKKEIVFVPYKASMWDSLESIWRAADEDESCDAYVIPAPYFDKNPDGSFRDMYYEGSLFPTYVPIIHYKDYNFENRRPDAIYVHNGYDDCNFVTSVHPFFYTKNLRKYTSKLVYVPYFILNEIEPDNNEAVEQVSHFCAIPGVYYSDKVIVQSEKMKQVYIKACMNSESNNNDVVRKYLEGKILGLGSPKIDKVLSDKNDNIDLPEKWQEIIKKPDGDLKKIVLYNTTISSLLQNKERWLEKIENTFVYFKEIRKNVALLWRPHPLLESTLMSMLPNLLGQYQLMRDNYIAERWGIYDNTADLERAIAISDGYYGDMSSIVQLYEKTGKPILLQTVNDDGYLCKSFFYDWIWEENEIIYFVMNWNMLCRTDLLTGRTVAIGKAEENSNSMLYAGVYKWNDYLILSSYKARSALAFYEYHSKKWEYINVEECKKEWLLFREESVFEFNGYLYIFSQSLVILKVNIEKRTIEYLFYPGMRPEDDIVGEIEAVGGKIYIPMQHSNKIFIFDLCTEIIQSIVVNTELKGIETLCFDGQVFWMTGIGKMICSWNERHNKSVSYCNFPQNFDKYMEREGEEGWWFIQSFYYKNFVYFVPSYANMILEMNIHTKVIREIFVEGEEENEESRDKFGRNVNVKYARTKQKDNMLMMLSSKNKNLVLLDLDTREIKKIEYETNYGEEDVEKGYNDVQIDIRTWIKCILRQTSDKREKVAKQELCGEKIYKEINNYEV